MTTTKLGVIYKITNPSGNCYVGKSLYWERRYGHYKNLCCKDQPALYASFLKHGFDKHVFVILKNDIPEIDLNIWETYFILKENSKTNGLNCTFGGDDSPMAHETARKKVSLSMMGNKNGAGKKPPRTKEHIENHSKSMKGKTPWNKGKKGTQTAWNKGISKKQHKEKKCQEC